jgi:uncharacterized protein involved in propanediol utilization
LLISGELSFIERARFGAKVPEINFSGVCHGTLGELFQGPFQSGGKREIAIVSLPVDKFSWAYFLPDGKTAGNLPDARRKIRLAIELFCAQVDVEPPTGRWDFHSEIPVGQGMASSTADVVATIRCLFNIHGLAFSESITRRLLGEIERADSVFLDEFALYLSAKQVVVRRLGDAASFHVCYAMEAGTVKTEELTDQLLKFYASRSIDYAEVLDGLLTGFAELDLKAIALASTRSAQLSQSVVPKAHFDTLQHNQQYFGADGIVVAHTGTVLGYLFADRPSRNQMDELSGFFRSMDLQCSFARGGCWNA